ncbi:hypothetical protein BDR04DRAFT_1119441 [Suillus decipiens]|nr:hypothetical protein BDR04DRAFT_1119441 [Suillus decipiens]
MSKDMPMATQMLKKVTSQMTDQHPRAWASLPELMKANRCIPAPQVTKESDNESNGCKANKASNWLTQAGHGAHTFSPSSTHQGLEHLATSLMVQEPMLRRTRPASDVLLVVEGRQPKTVPAPLEHLPRKKKAARFAAGVPSDAPAKGTRSNVENLCATCTRQKPKKYANYI